MSEKPVIQQITTFENGVPVVKNVAVYTPEMLLATDKAILAQPFTSPEDEEAIAKGLPPSPFYGRPIGEVMLYKSRLNAAITGDTDAVEKILDRHVGKPKITMDSRQTVTYEGFLQGLADVIDVPSVEAEDVGVPSSVPSDKRQPPASLLEGTSIEPTLEGL